MDARTAATQRRRHVWLAGVPVSRELAARIARDAREPTGSRLSDALEHDAVMAKLDREDEERILETLATDCPPELDELYRELLRRCRPSRASPHS